MTHLHEESLMVQAARQMLLQLLDSYSITAKTRASKDDPIYTKAELDLILSSHDAARRFLTYGTRDIEYYGHSRDNKGRLVAVKARFKQV